MEHGNVIIIWMQWFAMGQTLVYFISFSVVWIRFLHTYLGIAPLDSENGFDRGLHIQWPLIPKLHKYFAINKWQELMPTHTQKINKLRMSCKICFKLQTNTSLMLEHSCNNKRKKNPANMNRWINTRHVQNLYCRCSFKPWEWIQTSGTLFVIEMNGKKWPNYPELNLGFGRRTVLLQ